MTKCEIAGAEMRCLKGVILMVSFTELFMFCTLIISVITLVITICNGRKK